MKTEDELTQSGFTESGSKRYKKTIEDYSTELFDRSLALGKADKADNSNPEVTHEHVRSATLKIMAKTTTTVSPWKALCQIGEYVCAIAAGVGGSNLAKEWGILVFGAGLSIGVILFFTRNFVGNSR